MCVLVDPKAAEKKSRDGLKKKAKKRGKKKRGKVAAKKEKSFPEEDVVLATENPPSIHPWVYMFEKQVSNLSRLCSTF